MSLILSFPNTTSMWMLRSKQLIENITKTHIRKCQKNRVKKISIKIFKYLPLNYFTKFVDDLIWNHKFFLIIWYFSVSLCVWWFLNTSMEIYREKKCSTPKLKHRISNTELNQQQCDVIAVCVCLIYSSNRQAHSSINVFC